MFKAAMTLVSCLVSVSAFASTGVCQKSADIFTKGLVKSIHTVEGRAWLLAKPEFQGLDPHDLTEAIYHFNVDVDSCIISYKATFYIENCVITDLKVTEFCG